MGDFDLRSRIHPQEHDEPIVDDAHTQSQVEVPPAGGWSPDGPAVAPSSKQLPGLMTSAGAEQHPEMVWRDVPPTLIDFDLKSLEAEKLLKDFPSQKGKGPLKSVYEDMKEGRGDASAPEPTGAVANGVDQWAAETRNLEKDWQHLDPSVAADDLRQTGNKLLAGDHIPALGRNMSGVPDGAQAAFSPEHRALRVRDTPFQSQDDVDKLSLNAYHEFEHADQHGLVDRLMGGATMSADQQNTAMRMKDDFVDHHDEHARIEKLPAINTVGEQAHDMFKNMGADDQAIAAGSWTDLRAKLVDANDTYYKLPSEQDAYATEKKLKEKLDSK
jgi:hypothetical protein